MSGSIAGRQSATRPESSEMFAEAESPGVPTKCLSTNARFRGASGARRGRLGRNRSQVSSALVDAS